MNHWDSLPFYLPPNVTYGIHVMLDLFITDYQIEVLFCSVYFYRHKMVALLNTLRKLKNTMIIRWRILPHKSIDKSQIFDPNEYREFDVSKSNRCFAIPKCFCSTSQKQLFSFIAVRLAIFKLNQVIGSLCYTHSLFVSFFQSVSLCFALTQNSVIQNYQVNRQLKRTIRSNGGENQNPEQILQLVQQVRKHQKYQNFNRRISVHNELNSEQNRGIV